jgi:hypothetical protein
MIPVSWVEWITLPIRSWDLTINSPNVKIRVPTVIIATNFNKMPVKPVEKDIINFLPGGFYAMSELIKKI